MNEGADVKQGRAEPPDGKIAKETKLTEKNIIFILVEIA
jgi:hypothetical protein